MLYILTLFFYDNQYNNYIFSFTPETMLLKFEEILKILNKQLDYRCND